MKTSICIVYHSSAGHTKAAAELIASQITNENISVRLFNINDAIDNIQVLHKAHAIIFGCPTMFGCPSAEFKRFMEFTGAFWYRETWKNKFAAGFTVSSTMNGDKLNTLISLSLFAAQHGMCWISLGVLPRFLHDQQTDGQNRLASYLGLMMQSDNSTQHVQPFSSGDQLTAELFAKRIAHITTTIQQQQ
jgi:NAD(P)H dehydrogenase (quinone)